MKTTPPRALVLLTVLVTLLAGGLAIAPASQASMHVPHPEIEPLQAARQSFGHGALLPEADPQRPPTLAATLSLADLGYDADETLRGVVAVREYRIVLPSRSKVLEGSRFILHFSHAQALTENSSLAVDWNGRRLASVLLDDGNAARGVLEVSLPPESTLVGGNILRVEAFMSISPDYCEDIDNPAVWATIHRSSVFDLTLTPAEISADLSEFPQPLVDGSPFNTRPLTLVLPSEPTAAELTAAAAVSARLGQAVAGRMPSWEVASLDDWASRTDHSDAILVGRLDRLGAIRASAPSAALANLDAVAATQPDAALVWQTVLTPTDAIALVVTGATDAGVRQAGYALADQNVTALWRGGYAVLTDMPPTTTEVGPGRGIPLTFRQLGYSDVVARGTYEQVAHYLLRLPADWQRASQASLRLHFAHSALLHPSRSSLNLVLNDIPIGSLALADDTADDAWRTFRLPLRILRPGLNRLSVISNIRVTPPPDGRSRTHDDCRYDYAREAWVTIFADSVVEVPGTVGQPPADLAFYPAAFVGSDDLSEVVFVLPDPPAVADIFSLVSVAASVGQSSAARSLAPQVEVVSASVTATVATDRRHRILIGLPSRNGAIAAINEYLPQPFDLATDTPRRGVRLPVMLTDNARPGYVMAAALVEGPPVLIVTGGSYEGLQWAAAGLSDTEQTTHLKGPLAVSPAPGQLIAVVGGEASAADDLGIQDSVGANALTGLATSGLPASAIWVWLGCLTLAVAALLIRVYVLRWQLQKAPGDPAAALITLLSPALLGLWLILALSALSWLSRDTIEFGLASAVTLLAVGGGCLQSRWRLALLLVGAAALCGAGWGLAGINQHTLTYVGATLVLMGLTGWLTHSLCHPTQRWVEGWLANAADSSGSSVTPKAPSATTQDQ